MTFLKMKERVFVCEATPKEEGERENTERMEDEG